MCTESISGGGGGTNFSNFNADSGGSGGTSFIPPLGFALSKPEFKVGDTLTENDAKEIARASHGQLQFKNGHLTGHNPDGSGDVDITVGRPLSDGEIHDLHHTVNGSGGVGNSNHSGMNMPGPMNGHS